MEYFLDACWGAGVVDNGVFKFQFAPHYFLAPPDVFVTDHLPADPRDQLMSPPLSKEEFALIPRPRGFFYTNGCQLLSHTQVKDASVAKVIAEGRKFVTCLSVPCCESGPQSLC